MRTNATDASRNFSAVLNRVAAGDTVEIDRHGQVVAVMKPPTRSSLKGEELLALIARLPHADASFGDDVARLREVIAAPSDPWPS